MPRSSSPDLSHALANPTVGRESDPRTVFTEIPRVGGDDGHASSPSRQPEVHVFRRRSVDELQDVTAHQWLPADLPDLAHPEIRRHTDHAENLGGLQQCVMACEVHPTLGHAVYATKIAAIGHGDSQVVEHPPESVLYCVAGDFRWGSATRSTRCVKVEGP